jgi:hypothetical protein
MASDRLLLRCAARRCAAAMPHCAGVDGTRQQSVHRCISFGKPRAGGHA